MRISFWTLNEIRILAMDLFTARLRSTREGNHLTHVCLSTGWDEAGGPPSENGAYPHHRTGAYPHHRMQGTPTQDGILPVGLDEGTSLSMMDGGTPQLGWMGVPPLGKDGDGSG